MRYAALVLAMFATSAAAQDKPIDPVDFLVDWKSEIGHRFRIHDVTVYGASPTLATAKLSGQYFTVHEPWTDDNDLRFLLRYCAELLPSTRCQMTLTGTVSQDIIGNLQLTDVDFEIPQK